MATARDLIKASLRKIHVLGTGASLSATEADDALSELNDMIASFSVEGAMVFTETKETFSLTGAVSYQIGSGQTFNTSVPLFITAAYVTYATHDYPLGEIDEKQYARIHDKDEIGAHSEVYYYEYGTTGTLYLYPVQSGGTVTLYSRKALTGFTSLDTDFVMPEQYKTMLIHNLAVRLAPEYEKEASPTVQRIANTSKRSVQVQNRRNEKHVSVISGVPSQKKTSGDIYGGYW